MSDGYNFLKILKGAKLSELMDIDFTPFFKKYEDIAAKADAAFSQINTEYPDCVKCKIGCSDCCHALFDLTLIEAIYLNHQFNKQFEGEKRESLIEKANRTDRQIVKIKREAYKQLKAGKDENEIMANLARESVRCPLLNDEGKCDLYMHRPITCRFYGIPTSIGGKGHTCGRSEFIEGNQYPTVNLDIIHNALYSISDQLVKEIKSEHIKMSDILVPVSMAMLTIYNEEYLGIAVQKESGEEKE